MLLDSHVWLPGGCQLQHSFGGVAGGDSVPSKAVWCAAGIYPNSIGAVLHAAATSSKARIDPEAKQ